MIEQLRERKYKTLPTLNKVVEKEKDLDFIKKYAKFLKMIPKRTDFISFDDEGFALNDNTPIFKGWSECLEASSEAVKVAKLGDSRIYFNTKDGVIIVSMSNMTDYATYNDLAMFFEGKLKLT